MEKTLHGLKNGHCALTLPLYLSHHDTCIYPTHSQMFQWTILPFLVGAVRAAGTAAAAWDRKTLSEVCRIKSCKLHQIKVGDLPVTFTATRQTISRIIPKFF